MAKTSEADRQREAARRRALGYDGADAHSPRSTPRVGGTNDWYGIGFAITAIITFASSWIYCIASYGFLLGVGLGWLPSLIVAAVAGALWPLIALLLIAAVAFLLFTLSK